jgi:hypothetical protein
MVGAETCYSMSLAMIDEAGSADTGLLATSALTLVS